MEVDITIILTRLLEAVIVWFLLTFTSLVVHQLQKRWCMGYFSFKRKFAVLGH